MASEADEIVIHAGRLLAEPGQARGAPAEHPHRGRPDRAGRRGLRRSAAGRAADRSAGQLRAAGPDRLPRAPDRSARARAAAAVRRGLRSEGRARRRVPGGADAGSAGFTTVRDLGARKPEIIYALREAVAEGKVPGPRILCVGAILSPTGGHGQTYGFRQDVCACVQSNAGVCDGVDGCRRAVRLQVAQGADAIKFAATGGVLSNIRAGVDQQFTTDELTHHHRDRPHAGPAGLGPRAWPGGHQRGAGRRGRLHRARQLPRRDLDRALPEAPAPSTCRR